MHICIGPQVFMNFICCFLVLSCSSPRGWVMTWSAATRTNDSLVRTVVSRISCPNPVNRQVTKRKRIDYIHRRKESAVPKNVCTWRRIQTKTASISENVKRYCGIFRINPFYSQVLFSPLSSKWSLNRKVEKLEVNAVLVQWMERLCAPIPVAHFLNNGTNQSLDNERFYKPYSPACLVFATMLDETA